MDNNRSTYELIEDYLMHRLGAEERASVENRLASDAGFRQYFESQQSANRIIEEQAKRDIKEQLQHIHRIESAAGNGNRSRLIWAAGLLALIGLGIWWSQAEPQVKEIETESVDSFAEQTEFNTSSQTIDKKTVEPVITPADEKKKQVKENMQPIEVNTPAASERPEEIQVEPLTTEPTIALSEPETSTTTRPNGEVENPESQQASDGEVRHEHTPPVEKAPCLVYDALLNLRVTASCMSKNEGSIQVLQSAQGAFSSYTLNGQLSSADGSFKYLTPGHYELRAIDREGCESLAKAVEVSGYECVFTIFPTDNIYWDIDLKRFDEEQVSLEVYDSRSGAKLLDRTLYAFETNSWDGKSDTGAELPMGSYTYVLKSGTMHEMGSVTIVR